MVALERLDAPLRGTTQLPNFMVDRLLHLVSSDEWKVITYVVRQTLGFGRLEARISHSQFAHGKANSEGDQIDSGTGLSEPTIAKALKALLSHSIVLQIAANNRRNDGALYRVVIDAECVKWDALIARQATARQSARQRMEPIRTRLQIIKPAEPISSLSEQVVNSIDRLRPMALTTPEEGIAVNGIDHLRSTALGGLVNAIETQYKVLNKPLNQEESFAAASAAAAPSLQTEGGSDFDPDQTTEAFLAPIPSEDEAVPTPVPPAESEDRPHPLPPVPPSPAPSPVDGDGQTRVVNIHDDGVLEALKRGDPQFVYCGRKWRDLPASKWGNPFKIERDSADERRKAIDWFRTYFKDSADLQASIGELRGKTLVCHCKPKDCHCDVLAAAADGLLENQIKPPAGYTTMYASMTGKTAHFVKDGDHHTACGELTTSLLAEPKIGRAYRVCPKCQRALAAKVPRANEIFLQAVAEVLLDTPWATVKADKSLASWCGTVAGYITTYERNGGRDPKTGEDYQRLADDLRAGFLLWYRSRYPDQALPTRLIVKYWSAWDRAGRPRGDQASKPTAAAANEREPRVASTPENIHKAISQWRKSK